MARISRRHFSHAAGASLLAATLALPAGLSTAAAEARSQGEGSTRAEARATEPPPSPPSEPDGPSEPVTPPDTPSDTEPDEPTEPTEPSSTPDGTSDTTQPPDTGDTDGDTTEPPPEQNTQLDRTTTSLAEAKDSVPEELAPTVEKLIDIVGMVADPSTPAQDRQGVIESAQNLSTALAAISDPDTPPELREDLTEIVKQATSALEVVGDPRVPPEERSTLVLVIKRTTSTLELICDPKTPEDLRDQMIATVKDLTYVAERREGVAQSSPAGESASSPGGEGGSREPPNTLTASSSEEIVQDRRTPPKEREQLAKITSQVSALLRKISDPKTSQAERSDARRELEDKTSHMKDQQEESASAQERPEESLSKAAAVCTSAIFDSTPESALMRGLKELVPSQWQDEGVKDFWKAEEKSDDTLDVLAQLRNDERAHGPFEVAPLITGLAELVPHDKLFGTLGGSALSCEQTAKYLDEEYGVTAGTWLTRSGA